MQYKRKEYEDCDRILENFKLEYYSLLNDAGVICSISAPQKHPPASTSLAVSSADWLEASSINWRYSVSAHVLLTTISQQMNNMYTDIPK
jgi:hypothetical protein